MAQTNVNTTAPDCKPVDPEQPERDEAFEADLDRRLHETMEDYREQARRIHYAPPVDYSQREQLSRGTMRRLEVASGYVSVASKMLEWAAHDDLNAEHGDPPALDSPHLETLARLLGRAARGMELTLNNADVV